MNTKWIRGVEVAGFVRGYIDAMLWSETDESTPAGGEPLDENYDADDLTDEARERIEVECRAFLYRVGYLINEDGYLKRRDISQGTIAEYAGHDFWLTRAGHGTGFWDGDWTEHAGDVLTKTAKAFGEIHPFVQNGQVGLE